MGANPDPAASFLDTVTVRGQVVGARLPYLALRLKLRPEAFPSGPPNVAAIVEGADTILDPRTGQIGWSDNPPLCLAWYLRPWDGVLVDFDRLTPFPARVVGWRLAPEGGVDLTLAEEDAAVWDWNPTTDEPATGGSPSVVLPQPGVIAAPATIAVETPQTVAFGALAIAWAPVGSACLAGYEIEFRPLSVALWQGFAGGVSAVSATIPTAEPIAFRVRAQARSGAVSGWREALLPSPATGLTATGVAGGIQISGSVPGGLAHLQVFEAPTNDLAAATKLPAEPTALRWTRTGLTTGDARWLWLRVVSSEGDVSALAGPVTATALSETREKCPLASTTSSSSTPPSQRPASASISAIARPCSPPTSAAWATAWRTTAPPSRRASIAQARTRNSR